MADISYDDIVRLAEQLPRAQQVELANHLMQQPQQPLQTRKLSPVEWMRLLETTVIDNPPGEQFSLRREDWYDDDGR
jgi:hypothetical protein